MSAKCRCAEDERSSARSTELDKISEVMTALPSVASAARLRLCHLVCYSYRAAALVMMSAGLDRTRVLRRYDPFVEIFHHPALISTTLCPVARCFCPSFSRFLCLCTTALHIHLALFACLGYLKRLSTGLLHTEFSFEPDPMSQQLLAPRPSEDAAGPAPTLLVQKPRKISTACSACKLRKTKVRCIFRS